MIWRVWLFQTLWGPTCIQPLHVKTCGIKHENPPKIYIHKNITGLHDTSYKIGGICTIYWKLLKLSQLHHSINVPVIVRFTCIRLSSLRGRRSNLWKPTFDKRVRWTGGRAGRVWAQSLFQLSPAVTTDQRVRSQIQGVEMKAQRGRLSGSRSCPWNKKMKFLTKKSFMHWILAHINYPQIRTERSWTNIIRNCYIIFIFHYFIKKLLTCHLIYIKEWAEQKYTPFSPTFYLLKSNFSYSENLQFPRESDLHWRTHFKATRKHEIPDYISQQAWEHLGIPPKELRSVIFYQGRLGCCACHLKSLRA